MKTALLIVSILAPQLHGEAGRGDGVTFRDAPTNESLAKEYRETPREDPMKKLQPTKGEDPPVVNSGSNLLDTSDLITFNGQTTLVPKNAIIKIPDKFAGRINNHQQGAKIADWLQFLTANRGWITAVEVTLAQAKGEVPVSPELMDPASKNANLLVAVIRGGPVSVLPPKIEEKPATTTKTPLIKP